SRGEVGLRELRMTNTLHRYSDHYALNSSRDPAPIRDDYIVFAMATRGVNDQGLVEKYRTFLRMALKYNPVNVGDASKGALYQPSQTLSPLAHWRRNQQPDPERVIAEIAGHTTVAAVFNNQEAMESFVRELKTADLGVSINISAPMEAARSCCGQVGIARHSVEYSLGFRGQMDRLPDRRVLEIATMCGHGMVSFGFVRKMMDWVKEGRRSPNEAVCTMARFCICGVFNLSRAERLLEEARRSG
ncbi:MAG: hypothetical protein ACE5JU_25900, partial [Candidatus Binatia bacterium]